jgi:hypothetical protein
MTMLKQVGLVLSALMLGLLAMDVGERLSVPGVTRRPSADASQRRRRGAQDDAPLRDRRLQLLLVLELLTAGSGGSGGLGERRY